jgi:hypothetical protein
MAVAHGASRVWVKGCWAGFAPVSEPNAYPNLMSENYVVYFTLNPAQPDITKIVLSVPITDVQELSSKPLKWLRYAIGSVLGAEGSLEKYGENDRTVDFEDPLPSCHHFLYVPISPIRFVDIHGLDHLPSSQFTTESRTGFWDDVMKRDETCVVSNNFAEFCEASHLIPHSKGSEVCRFIQPWSTLKVIQVHPNPFSLASWKVLRMSETASFRKSQCTE